MVTLNDIYTVWIYMHEKQLQSKLKLPKIVDIHCIHNKLFFSLLSITSSKNLSAKNDNKKDCF